jgi:hypothetical protein
MLRQGDRVVTEQGTGTVVYVRFAPPDDREVAAVSVLLDGRARVGYAGTIFPADKVRPAAETPSPFYRGKQSRGSIHD